MLKIIIYKDKITATQFETELNDWIEYDITTLNQPLAKYFNRYVYIKEDVTVEDFMNHLERYEAEIDICFAGYNNEVPLRLFLEEMREEPKEGIGSDYSDVELVWQGEILNNTIGIFGHLLAFLSEEKTNEVGEENATPINLNWLPINVWKHCKFTASDIIMINNLGTIDDLQDELFFEGYRHWTLFEIISNFLTDITFNGTPEQRNKIASQLANKDYDVKEVAKNQEQAAYWFSFLEAELEELQEKLNEALETEAYEDADKLKKDIDAVVKELEVLREEVERYNIKK